jgi:small subunit ribosomal protein S9
MDNYTYAIGRRKTAVATVRLFQGEGESTINGKALKVIYQVPAQIKKLNLPFLLTNTANQYYFTAQTKGGGISGQLDAIVLAITRALVKKDEATKPTLKKANLLSRDDRMVERKKTGLRKARKKPQFSKR